MTNALTNGAAGGALGAYAGVDPFTGAAEGMGSRTSRTYMEFNGKEGRYFAGKEKVEVAAGTRIALDPTQFFRGHICWKNKKMMNEQNFNVIDLPGGRLPSVEQLGLEDFGPYDPPAKGDSRGDGYREQSGMRGIFQPEVFDGAAVEYKTNTKSAMIALGNLLKTYGMARRTHPEGSWPVVELGVDKFKVNGDTQYAPKFLIVMWLTPEQVAELQSQAIGGDAGDYAQDDQTSQQSAGHVGADAQDDEIPYDTQPVQQQAAAARPAAGVPPRPGNVPPRPGAPRQRAF